MFINPIELLELQSYSASTISGTLIKKQKRKLFADIDLSDNGLFDYKGIELTKADCEKAIEELENPDYITYYLYLAKDNQPLNDLLVNGDERFFTGFKEESIYKLPEFVNFISLHFAPRFAKALHKSLMEFRSESITTTTVSSRILQSQTLITSTDINIAFKNLSVELSSRIERIEKITEEINGKTTNYSDKELEQMESLVKELFPAVFLNNLPKYFQSQINEIASTINLLGAAIWNKHSNSSVSKELLEHLRKLNIESVKNEMFEKNYGIVKKADELNRCHYCDKRMSSPDAAYRITMYKETRRSFDWGRRTVEFLHREIVIPRCRECKEIHSNDEKASFYVPLISCSLIGLTLGLTLWDPWFIGLLGGGAVGYGIGRLQSAMDRTARAKKANTQTADNIRGFQPVKELRDQGWRFSPPTA
jgi:hypothetical protein